MIPQDFWKCKRILQEISLSPALLPFSLWKSPLEHPGQQPEGRQQQRKISTAVSQQPQPTRQQQSRRQRGAATHRPLRPVDRDQPRQDEQQQPTAVQRPDGQQVKAAQRQIDVYKRQA